MFRRYGWSLTKGRVEHHQGTLVISLFFLTCQSRASHDLFGFVVLLLLAIMPRSHSSESISTLSGCFFSSDQCSQHDFVFSTLRFLFVRRSRGFECTLVISWISLTIDSVFL